MPQHHAINYLEIPVKDIARSKAFFNTVFGWEYVDYGPEYVAINGAGIDAGLYLSDNTVSSESGSVLVVFYSADLQQSLSAIKAAGGEIIKDIFSFPGGKRFHFSDPNGNEYAVWSDTKE